VLYARFGRKGKSPHDGIDLAAPAGTPLATVLGFDDVILEIDNKSLTNRPDLWGHHGIARELATIYDLPLRPLPTAPRPNASPQLIGDVDVDLCRRFAAVAFDVDDAARQAPLWLRSRLARIGEATIDLCVDLSNYVMFTVGQPTHVYDADRIGLPLSVRAADRPVDLDLLNGSTVEITAGTPVIADVTGPVAVAGVMGGAGSAVGTGTRRYVLEAATFRPQPIRRASQRLGLRTEASARFEKALDTQRVDAAVDLFLHLLHELAPTATATAMHDVTGDPTEPATVNVGLDFLAGRIGAALDVKEIERTLDALGFAVDIDGDTSRIAAPTWRSTGDISLPHDIVEEVARIHGYDNLPTAPLAVALRPARALAARPVDRVVRETLATRAGMQEVVTYPWVSDAMLTAAGLDKAATVRFDGAPAPDRDSLRPSLVPNLFEAVTANLRYHLDVEIFEVGTVFGGGAQVAYGDGFEPMPPQPLMLAAIITGSDGLVLFRRAKGVLEQLSRTGHLTALEFVSADTAGWADASARVAISAGGTVIGTLGLLTKRSRRLAGLDVAQAVCFELDLGHLSAHTSRDNTFEALPDLPEADFDLSVVAADTVAWSDIAAAATAADPHIHRVVFVDEFRGSWVPTGHRSVTLRVTLRPADTTLTTETIAAGRSRVIAALAERTGAYLRA
jgi:phenylalanyl-tRNA synthetase beta chain